MTKTPIVCEPATVRPRPAARRIDRANRSRTPRSVPFHAPAEPLSPPQPRGDRDGEERGPEGVPAIEEVHQRIGRPACGPAGAATPATGVSTGRADGKSPTPR